MSRRTTTAAICVFAVTLCFSYFAGSSPAQNDANTDAAAAPAVSNGEYNPDDKRFIVHEWGTFTSFTGSDGVKLEFRPLVENDLPPFVIDRARAAGVPRLSEMLMKRSYLTMQRMETPVTYFYTNRERQIRAKVKFPEGLLTEFYPPVDSIGPPISKAEQQIVQSAEIETPEHVALLTKALSARENIRKSELDWGTLTLIPERTMFPGLANRQAAAGVVERMKQKFLPRSQAHFDYYYARQTDAAYVHSFRPTEKSNNALFKPVGDFFEKFLFYRGIGNFDLPLSMHGRGDGRFLVTNHSSEPIRSPILLNVDAEKKLRFAGSDVIPPGETIVLQLPQAEGEYGDLVGRIQRALVAEGLFGREASSMIATWRQSWFGEQGTRLFYLLPQPQTDAMLPLEVTPVPDETVRVMVGRLEVMTPELERKLEALLKKHEVTPAKSEGETPLSTALKSLGRFAEPALTRVAKLSDDPVVSRRAEALIEQVQVQGLK